LRGALEHHHTINDGPRVGTVSERGVNMQIRSLVLPVVVLAVTVSGGATAHAQAFLDVVTPDSIGGPRWTAQVMGGGGLKFVATPTTTDPLLGSLQFTAKDANAYAAVRNSDQTWHFKLSETQINYNVLSGGKQCNPTTRRRTRSGP
jgi:hypothetical protein